MALALLWRVLLAAPQQAPPTTATRTVQTCHAHHYHHHHMSQHRGPQLPGIYLSPQPEYKLPGTRILSVPGPAQAGPEKGSKRVGQTHMPSQPVGEPPLCLRLPSLSHTLALSLSPLLYHLAPPSVSERKSQEML